MGYIVGGLKGWAFMLAWPRRVGKQIGKIETRER